VFCRYEGNPPSLLGGLSNFDKSRDSALRQGREAARGAGPWRDAIASIAPLANSFSTTVHRPAAFSKWK
jgi:hypothetical protein